MSTNKTDEPSNWVTRFAPLIEAGGSVLDLACGNGRHSIFLASSGFSVTAVDRKFAKIRQDSKQIKWIEHDLENGDQFIFQNQYFMGVVVTNYLYRPLIPAIINVLDENGILIYETFSRGNERYGRPSNPDFLLKPGELLSACSEKLRVIAYEEGTIKGPKPSVKQRICAINSSSKGVPVPI
jgi:SAM-dependent methyltransferase